MSIEHPENIHKNDERIEKEYKERSRKREKHKNKPETYGSKAAKTKTVNAVIIADVNNNLLVVCNIS